MQILTQLSAIFEAGSNFVCPPERVPAVLPDQGAGGGEGGAVLPPGQGGQGGEGGPQEQEAGRPQLQA